MEHLRRRRPHSRAISTLSIRSSSMSISVSIASAVAVVAVLLTALAACPGGTNAYPCELRPGLHSLSTRHSIHPLNEHVRLSFVFYWLHGAEHEGRARVCRVGEGEGVFVTLASTLPSLPFPPARLSMAPVCHCSMPWIQCYAWVPFEQLSVLQSASAGRRNGKRKKKSKKIK